LAVSKVKVERLLESKMRRGYQLQPRQKQEALEINLVVSKVTAERLLARALQHTTNEEGQGNNWENHSSIQG
jgi:hypothetical protein